VTISKQARVNLRRSALALTTLAIMLFSDHAVLPGRRPGVIPPAVRNLMAAYGAEAVTIDPNAREFKLLDQVQWKGRPGSPNQTAILFGDPSKPGFYVQLLKRGPNDWSQPHSHANDRFITVLAGTMWIGTGSRLDPDNTVALKPGSYLRDIANQVHFDGTKADGVTIEIVGMGPSTMIPAEGK
jgi:hypothetical protein